MFALIWLVALGTIGILCVAAGHHGKMRTFGRAGVWFLVAAVIPALLIIVPHDVANIHQTLWRFR